MSECTGPTTSRPRRYPPGSRRLRDPRHRAEHREGREGPDARPARLPGLLQRTPSRPRRRWTTRLAALGRHRGATAASCASPIAEGAADHPSAARTSGRRTSKASCGRSPGRLPGRRGWATAELRAARLTPRSSQRARSRPRRPEAPSAPRANPLPARSPAGTSRRRSKPQKPRWRATRRSRNSSSSRRALDRSGEPHPR